MANDLSVVLVCGRRLLSSVRVTMTVTTCRDSAALVVNHKLQSLRERSLRERKGKSAAGPTGQFINPITVPFESDHKGANQTNHLTTPKR